MIRGGGGVEADAGGDRGRGRTRGRPGSLRLVSGPVMVDRSRRADTTRFYCPCVPTAAGERAGPTSAPATRSDRVHPKTGTIRSPEAAVRIRWGEHLSRDSQTPGIVGHPRASIGPSRCSHGGSLSCAVSPTHIWPTASAPCGWCATGRASEATTATRK